MIYKFFWFLYTILLRFRIKRIGLFSYFARPLFIYGGSRIVIGNKVRIFPGARMETHDNGQIYIEDNISIGQNLHLISSNEVLKIGKNTTISGNVFITNTDHNYKEINVHILDQKNLISTTQIGENCFIGYGAVLQAGSILGEHCVVGSNSVVRGVFPPFCVIVGSPAKIVKRYNAQTGLWEKTNKHGEFIN